MTRSSTAQLQDMFAQSTAVLARPSPQTFERFERRGGLPQALLYVVVAALVSAVIAAIFAPFHREVTVLGQFFGRLVSIPLQFFAFTGLVYFIGRSLFRGTGTYPEVAYSFALFYVPLSIVGTVIGIVPILGWLVSFVVLIAMVYFGYLAVQSSMNLRDTVSSVVTLVLSGLAYLVVGLLIGGMIARLFLR
ncbi:YIP1 family protein [Deinococcus petrolearius]|uniref:YIP1 family protein n=1 Tax=Deinococcus petrolearius TaxID=1751295 RepID=A0ABW1DMF8_9DEIO